MREVGSHEQGRLLDGDTSHSESGLPTHLEAVLDWQVSPPANAETKVGRVEKAEGERLLILDSLRARNAGEGR